MFETAGFDLEFEAKTAILGQEQVTEDFLVIRKQDDCNDAADLAVKLCILDNDGQSSF